MRLVGRRNDAVGVGVLEQMHHVARRLNDLMRSRRHHVAGNAGWETARKRRDEAIGDVPAEFERPWLIWNLPVGRIDDKARPRLNAEAGRVLFDVLGRKRTLPITLQVGPSVGSPWWIEGLCLRKCAFLEGDGFERTPAGGWPRRTLRRRAVRGRREEQHGGSAGLEY